MRLDNYTTVDKALIKEMIEFCRPPGVAGFDIAFKNSKDGYRGRAYWAGCSLHTRSKGRRANGKTAPYVVIGVHVARNKKARWKTAYKFFEGNGYLGVKVYDRVEALVYLTAHELRHLWQSRVPRGRRVWGARGRFSERDACAYGIHKLREWRRNRHTILFTNPNPTE